MLHRLMAAIRKEVLSAMRDPRSRRLVTLAPMMQLLVFAFAATMEVRNINVLVINQDSGPWSTELVQRIEAASFSGSLRYTDNFGQLQREIEQGNTLLGLHIPADFSRQLARGENASLQVIVDGRRANGGQISVAYLQQITTQLGIEIRQQQLPDLHVPTLSSRHWYNPNLQYRWFIVPSLGATLAMIVTLMLTTLSISRERELGTYDQLLVSPISPWEIIASKTLPPMVLGFILSTLVIVIAIVGFGIPFVGKPLPLLLGLMVFLFSIASIGLTISALCQTQQQAMMGMFFCIVPLMLISGFITPVENMPHWMQTIASCSPLTHFLILLQGAFLKDMLVSEMWDLIWPMLLIALITATSATALVRARME
jgi:drug efflux transport system permease protein